MLAAADVCDARIFYSPIATWVMVLCLCGIQVFPLLIYFCSVYWLLSTPYFVVAYLVNAWHNNSFALHNDQLFVINSNIPFRKMTSYSKEDIVMISLHDREPGWLKVFFTFEVYYADIETTTGIYRYYCSNLAADSFDENWTKETMDTFHYQLEQNGFPAALNLVF